MRENLADLVAEQQSLDQFLQGVAERDWARKTPAAGWDIRAQVSHLAHGEEAAAAVLEGDTASWDFPADGYASLDEWTAIGVARGRDMRYQEVIEWWRHSRARVVDALSRMEPGDRVMWVAGPLAARTFATLRLMETWAHGLDIHQAMDAEPEDTARIRHVAWLGWRMLPWAFQMANQEYAAPVRVELMGPNYARWVYGPEDTDQVVKGSAGEWCRVAVQRLDVSETALRAFGHTAEQALRLVRAY
jgi:uncharacterized protein (TIGR03084 family)